MIKFITQLLYYIIKKINLFYLKIDNFLLINKFYFLFFDININI